MDPLGAQIPADGNQPVLIRQVWKEQQRPKHDS
jgi:hypothetical protein